MGKGDLVRSYILHELSVGKLDNSTVRHRLMFGCMIAGRKEVFAGAGVNGSGTEGGIFR